MPQSMVCAGPNAFLQVAKKSAFGLLFWQPKRYPDPQEGAFFHVFAAPFFLASCRFKTEKHQIRCTGAEDPAGPLFATLQFFLDFGVCFYLP